ncbi:MULTISPECIES: SAVED domain-containing protein [Acidovorax]|uniref:SAVED domain-containing protein n=1 Tax=Acidovorax facilis TaxID=12917 RepID=A0ABV8D7Y0_9BURK|nr:SAVED domain-containing protein [Acidovorax sp. SD340]MBO1010832.1 SAVED domain-containing protein [Acidovorax sp. SD340]MCO4244347.1 SAVED domain-containing protein [Acidovorax facilis]
MAWLKKMIEVLMAYYTRTRRPVYLVMGMCVSLLVTVLGFNFDASWRRQTEAGVEELKVGTSGGAGVVGEVVGWAAVAFFVICASIVVFELVREFRAASRKRVICVELRGLVDTTATPLKSAIPPSYIGRREDCLVNVRDYLTGTPPNVQAAISTLSLIPEQVRLRCGDTIQADVTVVAGGILQVPLLFYAGMLLNDGGSKEFFDWERTRHAWQELAGIDDGDRFEVLDTDVLVEGIEEVVLAVSVSYRIREEHLKNTFETIPVVRLQLSNSALNELWSKEKQVALLDQFLKAINKLSDRGIKRIHLVLAAPASLSLRIGSAYDRNMPEVLVYQFEPKQPLHYPWSVAMPRAEGAHAQFVPTQQPLH